MALIRRKRKYRCAQGMPTIWSDGQDYARFQLLGGLQDGWSGPRQMQGGLGKSLPKRWMSGFDFHILVESDRQVAQHVGNVDFDAGLATQADPRQ